MSWANVRKPGCIRRRCRRGRGDTLPRPIQCATSGVTIIDNWHMSCVAATSSPRTPVSRSRTARRAIPRSPARTVGGCLIFPTTPTLFESARPVASQPRRAHRPGPRTCRVSGARQSSHPAETRSQPLPLTCGFLCTRHFVVVYRRAMRAIATGASHGLQSEVTSTRACPIPSQLVYTEGSRYRTSLELQAPCSRIAGNAGT